MDNIEERLKRIETKIEDLDRTLKEIRHNTLMTDNLLGVLSENIRTIWEDIKKNGIYINRNDKSGNSNK